MFCLASSGCRTGELTHVRWKDVNFNSRPVSINLRADYTKTRVGRTVFISDEAVAELKQWTYFKEKKQNKMINPNDLVFQTYNKKQNKQIVPEYMRINIQLELGGFLIALI